MSGETVTRLERFQAPYGREVVLEDVLYESGLRLLRLRLREGTRFTIMDLDAATAAHWGEAMSAWAAGAEREKP